MERGINNTKPLFRQRYATAALLLLFYFENNQIIFGHGFGKEEKYANIA